MKNALFSLIIFLSMITFCCQPVAKVFTGKSKSVNPNITETELQDHIKFLASDELKGRFPGTYESGLAIQYLINELSSAGITSIDTTVYIQTFEFVNSVELGADNRLNINQMEYRAGTDFIPLGFSSSDSLSAPVVFTGFGFSINDSIKWDDYNAVDVNEKWVLIIRGGPEDSPHSQYADHEALRKKVLVARDNEAAGVLFVSKIEDDEKDALETLRYDNSFSGAGIPVLQITQDLADEILKPAKANLQYFQGKLIADLAPVSFLVPNLNVSGFIEIVKKNETGTNVVGFIPGNDSVLKNEFIILGAHFDHLGFGGPGSGSLTPDLSEIHNGADDNASGISAVIEIAERLTTGKSKLNRSVVILGFDAEERGLIGSKYFVNDPLINLSNSVAMLNLDMIGRLSENRLTIGGTGTSPEFENILNEVNDKYGLKLKFSPEGYGPSDHASFYTADQPVLFFFTGTHEDYHKPTDDWEKINLNGVKKISDFVFDLIKRIDGEEQRPVFTQAGPKASQAPGRQFKVTFGIIPAYGSQVQGMEIDGVRKDGPAEKAGFIKGDIIIAIDGKAIGDIYDYMYRLGELKSGQTVIVDVNRDDQILKLEVTL
ncbi:M28 family peptidase [Candidatus Neomarinimicrobiota bacterium]